MLGGLPLPLQAGQNGHGGVVSALLESGRGDANKPDVDGVPPLCIAAYNGHAAAVRALVAWRGTDVNGGLAANGATPMFMASERGHAHVVRALLGAPGTDVNRPRGDGTTPLCVRPRNCHK